MTPATKFPKITVVTPSLNQGRYLEQTICSVVNQNYPNLEYIIMDGGSTDNSVSIIKNYERHLTYWQSERDHGQAAAINAGYAKGSGEILAWIASDDLLLPGSLERAAAFAANYPRTDFFYGHVLRIDGTNKIEECYYYPPVYGWITRRQFFLPSPGTFYRRSVWEHLGGLDETLHYCLDYDYYLRLMSAGRGFRCLGIPTAAFRRHPHSKGLIPNWKAKWGGEHAAVVARHHAEYSGAGSVMARIVFWGLQLVLLNYPRRYWSRVFQRHYRELLAASVAIPLFRKQLGHPASETCR